MVIPFHIIRLWNWNQVIYILEDIYCLLPEIRLIASNCVIVSTLILYKFLHDGEEFIKDQLHQNNIELCKKPMAGMHNGVEFWNQFSRIAESLNVEKTRNAPTSACSSYINSSRNRSGFVFESWYQLTLSQTGPNLLDVE